MTAHFADIAAAIRQRLADNWTTTPILYENLNAASIKTSGAAPDAFIALEILTLLNEQADMGDPTLRRYRTRGVIKIHIFTPASQGDGLGLQYADTLAAIYRGKSFSGVVCSGASIRGIGNGAEATGNYWRQTLAVEFYADKVFNVS